jgi:hypothetical protein
MADTSWTFAGEPSDDTPAILATGTTDITTIFTSMSTRHPEGDDAAYLRWHTLDHRPEQYRLSSVRSSLRIVSTPACRAARAASDASLDATDHVMTYFFAGTEGLEGFNDLAVALREAGRMPYLLPSLQRAVYNVETRIAAPRAKAGADVLPWWPAKGVYLLIEQGDAPSLQVTGVPGVAGLWSAKALDNAFSSAAPGQQISYLFLDGDPVETAERLRPILTERWASSRVEPLLAAPFFTMVPYEWDRYLP